MRLSEGHLLVREDAHAANFGHDAGEGAHQPEDVVQQVWEGQGEVDAVGVRAKVLLRRTGGSS